MTVQFEEDETTTSAESIRTKTETKQKLLQHTETIKSENQKALSQSERDTRRINEKVGP